MRALLFVACLLAPLGLTLPARATDPPAPGATAPATEAATPDGTPPCACGGTTGVKCCNPAAAAAAAEAAPASPKPGSCGCAMKKMKPAS